jgi:hypothetical protein
MLATAAPLCRRGRLVAAAGEPDRERGTADQQVAARGVVDGRSSSAVVIARY